MSLPECLSDSVGAQVNDLHQVISGAGEQLGAVVVQVQGRHPAQQLQLAHNTFCSDIQMNRDNMFDFLLLNALLYNTNVEATACFRLLRLTCDQTN